MNRQFCCVCLRTTADYTTLALDRRTDAERATDAARVNAGRPPIHSSYAVAGQFHYCMRPECQARYAEEKESQRLASARRFNAAQDKRRAEQVIEDPRNLI